ncbi:hypothetical protein [Epilithonimonas caeni]|uniref:hypothetical protein n=1 Tax=Epilithonimonas caeni TaxID=365343 RepID=UPI000414888F|nr:hypothetical protein [Epilithonimonas caeni]
MKKQILTSLSILSFYFVSAQVGINNPEPKATLDVTAKKTDGTTAEGIIVPRLKGIELKSKDNKYSTDQTGAIIYITEALDGNNTTTATTDDVTPKTINVTTLGYYYFDGTVWIKFTPSYVEPWYNSATNTEATANTQNIYQMGNVSIGTNTTGSVQLNVTKAEGNWNAIEVNASPITETPAESRGIYLRANATANLAGNNRGIWVEANPSAQVFDNWGLDITANPKSSATINGNNYGVSVNSRPGGKVSGNNYGIYLNTDIQPTANIMGNSYGVYILTTDTSGTVSGNRYGIFQDNEGTGTSITYNYIKDNLGINSLTPKEKLDVNGAVKISTSYISNTIVNGSTTPIPQGGAGTIIFQNSHFFGWNGSAWKQLDN